MLALDFCTIDGPDNVIDSLPTPIINVRGWTHRINAPGKFVFSIDRNHEAATDENLQMWRPVRLFRKPRDGTPMMLPVWYGFILAKQEIGERVEVVCMGGLKIFTKRETADSAHFTGQGSAAAFGLLSATNGTDGSTSISVGSGGVTATMDITLDHVPLLTAAEEFAAATGAEFEVDPGAYFNFVPALGSDKSEAIELIFNRNGEKGTNLLNFEIAEDGEPMANKIIGTTTAGGGLESEYVHPTSSDTYPVLIERKAFNHANDQTTLDALTEAYGLQRSLPIPDFVAIPATATKKFNPFTGQREVAGLQYEDVQVGDLVLVTIVTGSRSDSTVKRIAELIVEVDEHLNERLRFTFSGSGVFVTGGSVKTVELLNGVVQTLPMRPSRKEGLAHVDAGVLPLVGAI